MADLSTLLSPSSMSLCLKFQKHQPQDVGRGPPWRNSGLHLPLRVCPWACLSLGRNGLGDKVATSISGHNDVLAWWFNAYPERTSHTSRCYKQEMSSGVVANNLRMPQFPCFSLDPNGIETTKRILPVTSPFFAVKVHCQFSTSDHPSKRDFVPETLLYPKKNIKKHH